MEINAAVPINGRNIQATLSFDKDQLITLITSAFYPGSQNNKSLENKGYAEADNKGEAENNASCVLLYSVNKRRDKGPVLDTFQKHGQATPKLELTSQPRADANPNANPSPVHDITRSLGESPCYSQRHVLTSQEQLRRQAINANNNVASYDVTRDLDDPMYQTSWYLTKSQEHSPSSNDFPKSFFNPHDATSKSGEHSQHALQHEVSMDGYIYVSNQDAEQSLDESQENIPTYWFDSQVPLPTPNDILTSFNKARVVTNQTGEYQQNSFQHEATTDVYHCDQGFEERVTSSSSIASIYNSTESIFNTLSPVKYVLKANQGQAITMEDAYFVGQTKHGGASYEYCPKPNMGMSQGMGTRSKAQLPGATKDYILPKTRRPTEPSGSQNEAEPPKEDARAFKRSSRLGRSPPRGTQPFSTESLPGNQKKTEDHPGSEPMSTGSLPGKAMSSRATKGNPTNHLDLNRVGSLINLLELDEASTLMPPPPAINIKTMAPSTSKVPFTIFKDSTERSLMLPSESENESEAAFEFAGREMTAEEREKWKAMTKSQKKRVKTKERRHQKTAEKSLAVSILEPLSSTIIEAPQRNQHRRSAFFAGATAISEVDSTLQMNTIVVDEEHDDANQGSENAFTEQQDLTIQSQNAVPAFPRQQSQNGDGEATAEVSPTKEETRQARNLKPSSLNVEDIRARLHNGNQLDPFSIVGRIKTKRDEEARGLEQGMDKRTVEKILQRENSIRASHLQALDRHMHKIKLLVQQNAEKDVEIAALHEDYKKSYETNLKVDGMEREFEFLRNELIAAHRFITEIQSKPPSRGQDRTPSDTTRGETAGSQPEGRNTRRDVRMPNSQSNRHDSDTGHNYEVRDENNGQGEPQDGDTNRDRSGREANRTERTTNTNHFASTSFPATTFQGNNNGNNGDDEDDDERRRRQRQLGSTHQNFTLPNIARPNDGRRVISTPNETKVQHQTMPQLAAGNPGDPNDPSDHSSGGTGDSYDSYMRRRERSRKAKVFEQTMDEYRTDQIRRERQRSEERRQQKLEDRRYQEERDFKKMQMDALKDALTTFVPGDDVLAFIATFRGWMDVVKSTLTNNVIFVKFVGQLKGGAQTWVQSGREQLARLPMERVLEELKGAFPPKSDFEREVNLKEWTYDEKMDPNRFWNELLKRINDLGPDVSEREKAMHARDALQGDMVLKGMVQYNNHRTLAEVHETFFKYVDMKNTFRLQNGEKSLFKGNGRRYRNLGEAYATLLDEQEDEEVEANAVQTGKPGERDAILQAFGMPPGFLKLPSPFGNNRTVTGSQKQGSNNANNEGRQNTTAKETKPNAEEAPNPRYKGRSYDPNFQQKKEQTEEPQQRRQQMQSGRTYGSNNGGNNTTPSRSYNNSSDRTNTGFPSGDSRGASGNSRTFSNQSQRGNGDSFNDGGFSRRNNGNRDRNNNGNREQGQNGNRGPRRTMENCYNCVGHIPYYHLYTQCPIKEVRRLTGNISIQDAMAEWTQTITNLGGNNFKRPQTGVMDAAFNIIAEKYRTGRGQFAPPQQGYQQYAQLQQAYPNYAPAQLPAQPTGTTGQNPPRPQQTQQQTSQALNG